MFTFELVHVPAERHQGPDALSRHPVANGEPIEDDDDSWLDEIALLTFIPYHNFPPFPNFEQTPEPKVTSSMQYYHTE